MRIKAYKKETRKGYPRLYKSDMYHFIAHNAPEIKKGEETHNAVCLETGSFRMIPDCDMQAYSLGYVRVSKLELEEANDD